MTQDDFIAIAKNHPDTVTSLLASLNEAVQADKSIVPDIAVAVETHSPKAYGLLVWKHLSFFKQVASIVEGNQALRDQVSTVISGS